MTLGHLPPEPPVLPQMHAQRVVPLALRVAALVIGEQDRLDALLTAPECEVDAGGGFPQILQERKYVHVPRGNMA